MRRGDAKPRRVARKRTNADHEESGRTKSARVQREAPYIEKEPREGLFFLVVLADYGATSAAVG